MTETHKEMEEAVVALEVAAELIESDNPHIAKDIAAGASLLAKVGQERDQAVSANAGMREALEALASNRVFALSGPETAARREFAQAALTALPTGTPATPKPSENNGLSDTDTHLPATHTGEPVAVVSALQEENARLRKLLGEALTNGLIYWEPNTARGHERKTDMVGRIETALSQKAEGDAS